MKAVILAGGLGTRLGEETGVRPKPMVEIGGKPILWHIMKTYSAAGINDFVICLGYKGYQIKEYLANYFLHSCDVTIDVQNNRTEVHQNLSEPWKITLVETGENTMTGGRIKRVKNYVGDETFCLTYGDGLGDVAIPELVKFHQKHGKLATLTSVQPPERYGVLELQGDQVRGFREKPKDAGSWINGGFFVLSPKIFDYIDGDSTIWEREPLERLAVEGQLRAFRHEGFWQPMDTLREKIQLEALWSTGQAPWKVW